MIKLTDIKKIIKLSSEGKSEKEIYDILNDKASPSKIEGICSEKDAKFVLIDGKDKEYFFKDKESARKFWHENNFYETTNKSKIRLFDYLAICEDGTREIIMSI